MPRQRKRKSAISIFPTNQQIKAWRDKLPIFKPHDPRIGLRRINALQAAMHHLRAPGDNSIKLAKARHLRTERAWSELRERLPLLMQKYRLQLPDQSILELAKDNDLMSEFEEVSLQIELLQGIRQPDSLGQQVHPPTHGGTQTTERDEFEALQETAPDLARLDCYERRLLSRQRRAIYNLDGLKVGV